MTSLKTASALAIAAAFGLALPASADVTADQVWAAWKAIAQGSGQSMTGRESRSGTTLTVEDLQVASQDGQGGSVRVGLGQVAFAERGDGSVEIRMPETHPLTVETRNADGHVTALDFTLRQPGFEMVASGTPEALKQDVTAPEVTLTLDRVSGGKPVDVQARMTVFGMTGHYAQSQGGMRTFESGFEADRVQIDFAATDPADGTQVTLVGSVHDIDSSSDSRMPVGGDPTQLGQMLRAGFTSQGALTHGAMGYTLDVTEKGDPTHVEVSANSGRIGFDLGGTGMAYDVTGKDTRVALSTPQLPMPQVELQMAETGLHFEMPLMETETPADFGLGLRLAGVTVSKEVWALFDPTGQLPRDPATLIVDLAGKARWLADLTDPAIASSDDVPAELHALNVKDLRLQVAGADLTGSGDFTFDNADKVTFSGIARPEGTLSLRLAGGNGLMDKLVAMGLIPQDQAMGLRMMMGMFARPGDGPDTMVSEITVNGQGQVLANGQRLR
ncbi:hypothetical protein BV509_00555 [Rhodovulum sulfidophilum]|uniref:DUF2125 domain-containing protein n=1 Tax=Rhodovulum visakhapatnamense TaxID=364297 RepID=A0ABS1RBB4_9RHOB|nr:DUF2125 domain-containing protein [Rhodovulum visakhapatnamense]MBL3570140.1 DUF2125 domain-containing protein [Rhodovulum visakhapatnamense]MBL3576937.1 DUF2125 domain-containing protein [Rhodovulum visakhapatnamense]OLS42987.1 hypothetical protein BV509_00555 [Rhodovulum sulfidophilum]